MGMKLLSISDLCGRWNYTKQGVHKLTRSKNFPDVFATVNKGRTKIYTEESIEEYEKNKSWLFDEGDKLRRVRLFCLLKTIKEDPSKREKVLGKCFGSSAK